MPRPTPIFASEATAAVLLDLKVPEFRLLVSKGHLPNGQEIAPGFRRWDTEVLRRIGSGDGITGMSEVVW